MFFSMIPKFAICAQKKAWVNMSRSSSPLDGVIFSVFSFHGKRLQNKSASIHAAKLLKKWKKFSLQHTPKAITLSLHMKGIPLVKLSLLAKYFFGACSKSCVGATLKLG